ncbi:transglycosylase family protein [Micropruina sp.]|uniref:resuscitation-promoting factor n=1 Tax=Micropruina sp. TaxID=2737536 RepID=UPI0039E3EBE7
MRFITRLTATAGCATLLLGGLVLPAHAETGTTTLALDVSYAGVTRQVTVAGAATVADALTHLELAVDDDDVVSPALDTTLTDGMTVVVDVVSTSTTVKNVTLKYSTVKVNTKKLPKGTKKVVKKGRNGKAARTFLTTTVNGVSTTAVVAETITKKVVDKVVKVGSGKLNLARLKKWNKIAKCESGGRWAINTGNGYYGGLQFSLATWRSVKGRQFATYPHKASKAEQITVANRLYAKRGFKPWGCRHVL